MKDIRALCKAHRARVYFDGGLGIVGVFNHRDVVVWYQLTLRGYSLCGETATPQGAPCRGLESAVSDHEQILRDMVA